MRVWLYARLSNDDDRQMNSLSNQLVICRGFAEEHMQILTLFLYLRRYYLSLPLQWLLADRNYELVSTIIQKMGQDNI